MSAVTAAASAAQHKVVFWFQESLSFSLSLSLSLPLSVHELLKLVTKHGLNDTGITEDDKV